MKSTTTRRGKAVAKVVPSKPAEVDWKKSAALNRTAWPTVLSAERSAAVRAAGQGA